MAHILHMTELERWKAGGDVEADSLAAQGFVHASPDDKTLLAVANALYTSVSEPLVALVVDTGVLDSLGVETRWEAADPAPPPGTDGDVLFPHVYGAVPREAVREVRHLRRAPDGRFTAVEDRPSTAEALDLLPHPEGGWYRRTWESGVRIRPEGYPSHRPSATGIHFLLCPGEESRWHRVRSDEMWVFQRGGPLRLDFGGTGPAPVPSGGRILGSDLAAGESLQVLVPAGTWQSARPAVAEEVLVGCFVSPGFDFADFESV
ncbi:cupin domain-containing protein [Nocardiopsis lambiniae]|uniref:Cupin domain-containing protein n=1 Tax=Nocardiopsis lambiniae TaxID=3075539 RepID=A0ABU2MAS4_9ACTN|nr:cupin domain-containing protein [Nocardiopsis sp. DSM 44743]MDT0329777.1 cupin domain-containing protein [Nocardiopsis sp. DSM 44743]